VDLELQQRLLTRAAEITGGTEALSRVLGVDLHSLELWLTGRATVPGWIGLAAMDMVLDDDVIRATHDRRRVARVPTGMKAPR